MSPRASRVRDARADGELSRRNGLGPRALRSLDRAILEVLRNRRPDLNWSVGPDERLERSAAPSPGKVGGTVALSDDDDAVLDRRAA